DDGVPAEALLLPWATAHRGDRAHPGRTAAVDRGDLLPTVVLRDRDPAPGASSAAGVAGAADRVRRHRRSADRAHLHHVPVLLPGGLGGVGRDGPILGR